MDGARTIVSNPQTMPMLATLLSASGRETVLDMTELKSAFAVKLEWTQEPAIPNPASAAEPREPAESQAASLWIAP